MGNASSPDGSYRHGNRAWVPFFQGLLADIEATVEGVEGALTQLDEALSPARELENAGPMLFCTASAVRFY